ncbi:hypothetical protein K438DRAFT_2024527 [Mycena galopus ATCC 62051]|nr:hypothetical protein K438DRAFT_2024527 [Mycena galopus ATCC 62051]
MISLRSLSVFVTIASSVCAEVAKPPEPCDAKVTYWFSFGDSYTTTGFSWNGTLPSVGNPLGNPTFPGVTGGGGENYVGFNTVMYNKSLILSYDYGVGGAVIDPTLVTPLTLALPDEITQFLEGAAKKPKTSPWTSEDALFSVWIGINDLGNTFYLNGSRSAYVIWFRNSSTYLLVYLHVPHFLTHTLSNAGGRNFLFINVPPTYRAPLIIGFFPTQLDVLKTVIEGFNSKLAAKVQAFKEENHGVETWLWDAYTTFNIILDDPHKYGFINNFSYSEPGDFWANTYHPSMIIPRAAGDIVIRQFQPKDAEQVHALLVEGLVHGWDSPHKEAQRRNLLGRVSCLAYLGAALGTAGCLYSKNFAIRVGGGALALGAAAVFVYMRQCITGIFVKFCAVARATDMADICRSYEVPISANDLECPPDQGPAGFWVAAIESPEQKTSEVVGYLGLDYRVNPDPSFGELRRMIVSIRHRRRKIGSLLIVAAVNHARHHSPPLETLDLETTEFQPGARKLYENHGFSVVGSRIMRMGIFSTTVLRLRRKLSD